MSDLWPEQAKLKKQQSSIDDKLLEIAQWLTDEDSKAVAAIAQIKQAFADEDGRSYRELWVKEFEAHKRTKTAFLEMHQKYRKSGQEFYSRFEKELPEMTDPMFLEHADTFDITLDSVIKAARRAAGITEPYGRGEIEDMKHVQDKLDEPYSGITEAKDE